MQKIIYCIWTAEKDLSDHRKYIHNLNSCEMKAWKNIQTRLERDLNPWPLRYWNSQCDQLPVGLIAPSVEYCTVIAESRSSLNFFQALISQQLKVCVNCDDQSCLHTRGPRNEAVRLQVVNERKFCDKRKLVFSMKFDLNAVLCTQCTKSSVHLLFSKLATHRVLVI